MTIQDRLATGKGKFTPRYPELGTGPVDYEDSMVGGFAVHAFTVDGFPGRKLGACWDSACSQERAVRSAYAR